MPSFQAHHATLSISTDGGRTYTSIGLITSMPPPPSPVRYRCQFQGEQVVMRRRLVNEPMGNFACFYARDGHLDLITTRFTPRSNFAPWDAWDHTEPCCRPVLQWTDVEFETGEMDPLLIGVRGEIKVCWDDWVIVCAGYVLHAVVELTDLSVIGLPGPATLPVNASWPPPEPEPDPEDLSIDQLRQLVADAGGDGASVQFNAEGGYRLANQSSN